jgi:hypothetical protein
MKLRFKVNQAEALRQGVDAPTSVVTIEINPKELAQEERTLLADRMDGIDLRELHIPPSVFSCPTHGESNGINQIARSSTHITATLATFAALMAAVRANEEKVRPVAPKAEASNRTGQ